MNKYLAIVIASLLLPGAAAGAGSGCEAALRSFLAQPNEVHYGLVTRMSARFGDCWSVVAYSARISDGITKLMKDGNEWAITYVATSLSAQHGESYTDALLMMSEAVKSNPAFVLALHKRNVIHDYALQRAVIALPPDATVRNREESLKELKRRLERIESVRDNSLRRQREMTVDILKHTIRGIEQSRTH